jgi:hypothetical protein
MPSPDAERHQVPLAQGDYYRIAGNREKPRPDTVHGMGQNDHGLVEVDGPP